MNSQTSNGWPPAPGSGAPPINIEHTPGQQRHPATFGPNQPPTLHQPSSTQINGPSMLHQPGPFFSNQSNGPNLTNPQNVPQAPPLVSTRRPPLPQQQHSPPSVQQHVAQHPSYSLTNLGPAVQQQQSPPTAVMVERELERDRLRDQQMQHEALLQQRYDHETEILHQQQEQQQREQHQQQQQQQQREQLPSPREHHNGTIPIQQPIASRVPATLHGPNGILNDQHAGASVGPPQSAAPIGVPNPPGSVFVNGVQSANENSLRPLPPHITQSLPPQQLLGFGNTVTSQQLPNGVAALTQGQQPILNDALSYLDQVKVRFVHQPDVYNQFLDIMKDFKSQAIDTPGVIDRVSSLFAGHPELIQGFNTFLPPGYRIECGTTDDPNAIRVTTPMGTTVSQMPSIQPRVNGLLNGVSNVDGPRQGMYQDSPQASIEWTTSQNDEDGHGNLLATARRGGHPVYVGQEHASHDGRNSFEREDHSGASQAALLAHQQEQRGVSHLSNAVSVVATNGAQGRHTTAQVSPGEGQVVSLGQTAAGLSNAALTSGAQLMEKRGPVEFNHAIGYVNKIKNRFATQPEIYKSFLEILQTYQRETKPIQDVYAQVTQLFGAAPDLLEDFKQFLPESAAQAKAQAAAKQATEDAAMLSNVRGDFTNGAQNVQAHTPRGDVNMPPVGIFAPPSATKESKKRRGGPGSQMTGGPAVPETVTSQNTRIGGRGNASKRAKVEPAKPVLPEAAPASPSLVPSLPSPMPPSKGVNEIADEINFFDRVKKSLADKKMFNEFLKLCNLFTQDLIDQNTLMHKAYGFIGSNAELTSWFKNFLQYDGRDEIIENKPKIPGDKVVLSNCRGLGPSYRLLPKRERLRTCSGRDEMCKQVLNDEWVSHPTWASEDSGFIAHRKNIHEEALHRIEEERHDYDINIEACLQTIQLMEPIVQQIQMMSPAERATYILPPGLGGQSETIYQRVIKKIYDREKGCKVIEDMFKRPSAVLPVVLGRLKQKVEEWKATQREWEKVWREQTNKIFWKSLDHQGIAAKKEDKRQFQPKTLQTEIQVKYEEQRRQRLASWHNVPRYQLEYEFKDMDVICDACHLILTQLNVYNGTEVDKIRLESLITTFIPTFFDIDRDTFQDRMSDIYDKTPPNEEAEDESINNEDSNTMRGRKNANGRKSNLLRGVLDRSRQAPKEESILESKETTPDQSHDEDTPASTGTPTEYPSRIDEAEFRWTTAASGKAADRDVPFKRDYFHLYASLNIYCFFRVFQMLYDRLLNIKLNEESIKADVRCAELQKAADELNLTEKKPSEYFADVSPSANYYRQILTMCEDVVKQEEDLSALEEMLRRFYMQKGWLLFNFDKMLQSLLRFALSIHVSDNRDKSLDIINLFYKDRKDDETTHQAELTYRKQVEKLAKDGDIYRIRYDRSSKAAFIQIFKKDEKTFEAEELASTARWSYYVSTFTMRERTEGVQLSDLHWPFLKRNMPPMLDDEDDYNNLYGSPQWNEDGLILRISQDNYHLLYDSGTSEWWIHNTAVRKRGLGGYEDVQKERTRKFETLFGKDGALMIAKAGDRFEKESAEFQQWIQNGPSSDGDGNGDTIDDEIMGGT